MIWLHDSSHAAMFQTELFTHTALQMFKMQASDKLLAVLAHFVLTVSLTTMYTYRRRSFTASAVSSSKKTEVMTHSPIASLIPRGKEGYEKEGCWGWKKITLVLV